MEDIKKNFSFSVKHQNKNYRVGLIQTHRGEINTPAFMPVGTQATVKSVFIDDGFDNVNAARKMGIIAHQYTNFKDFKIFLDKFLKELSSI